MHKGFVSFMALLMRLNLSWGYSVYVTCESSGKFALSQFSIYVTGISIKFYPVVAIYKLIKKDTKISLNGQNSALIIS